MKKHTKIYLESRGYSVADAGTIPCEIRVDGCEGIVVDVHHIEPRGMGGDPSKDVPENLIGSCRSCHEKAEAGTIPKEELKTIVKGILELGPQDFMLSERG